MAINTGKVVVGGLAAGVVMNVIDFVTQSYMLRTTYEAEMNKLNPALLQGMMGSSTIAQFVALDFAYGILLVFLYAAIRPRFGPGAGTAVKAGLTLWLASGATWAFTSVMGMFSWGFFAMSGAVSLVNFLVGAYVGAMLYRED